MPERTYYRCTACGNRTRFDVFESKRARQFHHYSLGGDLSIEEEEVLERTVEKVVCRWCGSADSIEQSASADAENEADDVNRSQGEPG